MPTIFKRPKSYKRTYTEKRKERQSIYNSARWRKISKNQLMYYPLCQVCQMENKTTAAQHVHHIISFMEFEDEQMRKQYAYDPTNIISVCEKCHNKRLHGGDLDGCRSLEEIEERINNLNNKRQDNGKV